MNSERARGLRLWLPVAACMLFIFLVSCIPAKNIPDTGIPNFNKIFHLLEFIILGILLTRAFYHSYQCQCVNLIFIVILSIGIASLYAASDEWHQYFVPGRDCDFFDFVYDLVGSIVGVFLYTDTL